MISDTAILTFAYKFSARKHTNQRRKGIKDIPYINHPIEVANLLAQTGNDNDIVVLAAAVLHDTIEDTDTTFEELKAVFGDEIAEVVLEVSDDMTQNKAVRKELQIEKAPTLSDRAKKIKIADKTCNILDIIQTRYHWTNPQKIEYVNWCVQVVEKCSGVNPELDREFEKALNYSEELIGWVDKRKWK